MAEIQGTILAAKISPGDTDATFPTHEDIYGKGGLMSVSTLVDLSTAVPLDRQKVGMLIHVSEQSKYYTLSSLSYPVTAYTQRIANLADLNNAILNNYLPLSGGTLTGNLKVNFNLSAVNVKFTGRVEEGSGTKALGTNSHAEGSNTTASGNESHAEGNNTTASGTYSHAEGVNTRAAGNLGSHAEGSATFASGFHSHAEGLYTTATGLYSHAEGYDTATGQRIDFLTYTASTRLFTFSNLLSSKFSTLAAGTVLRAKNTFLNFYQEFTVASRNSINGAISARSDVFSSDTSNGFIIFESNSAAGAHAEGYLTTAFGSGSHAEGGETTASGTFCHAEGYSTTASGNYSHAEGYATIASGNIGSHAEGFNTTASGNFGSHAEGYSTIASKLGSHAEGRETVANGSYSHAAGVRATAAQNYTYAWSDGNLGTLTQNVSTTRTGQYMISASGGVFIPGNMGIGVDGYNVGLSSNKLTVFGNISSNGILYTNSANSNEWITDTFLRNNFLPLSGGTLTGNLTANADLFVVGSVIEGSGTASYGLFNHVEGINSVVLGNYSHAEGSGTVASGTASHSEGEGTTASGYSSHAEGGYTTASGDGSHAEGEGTTASDLASHAEGRNSFASSIASHAEGDNTSASGEASHAEGYSTTASGNYSHAEGGSTTASGTYSHAEGDLTIASGAYSHSEGVNTHANSNSSHAEGASTRATAIYSHAEGRFSEAKGIASHSAGFRATAAQNYTYAWSDGNLGTLTQNVSTTRTGQYMVSASGGMFVAGRLGVGTDFNANGLTVLGNTSLGAAISSIALGDAAVDTFTLGLTLDDNSPNPAKTMLVMSRYTGNAGDVQRSPNIKALRSRGASTAAIGVSAGDALMSIRAWGMLDGGINPTQNSPVAIQMWAAEKYTSTAQGSYITFRTQITGSSLGSVERMRIDHTGNVGIGTTTPAQALTVNGNISASNRIYDVVASKPSTVSPSASAVVNMVYLSEATYTGLAVKDPSTIYIIV